MFSSGAGGGVDVEIAPLSPTPASPKPPRLAGVSVGVTVGVSVGVLVGT